MNKSQIKILPPPPSPSYQRSDFEFQRKIGDGAFGQVWRVRHKKSLELYAIKQVGKSKVLRLLDQFLRELRIMYSLDHPHIVKLHSHFEDDKFFYLLMELIEGGTLFHKLSRENVLLERVAAQYFREIVLAIEYLHTRSPQIIHRDIKPENILICRTGKLKLSDFGWANYVNKTHARMTSCGTLEYLPPEMVDEQGYDTCADVWCLGVLLYEMLAGTTPFKANGKEKIMKNIKNGLVKFPIGFSHIAKELVCGMLERNTGKRMDIFMVKKHRWLAIMQPIRETMVQNLSPKILSFVESEKTDEVTTAYSDNDTDEEVKAGHENAFRRSIQKIKIIASKSAREVVSNRASLKENCKEYFNMCQREKDLEEKIKERNKEIGRILGASKEVLAMCFDANLELERLQTQDNCALAEQNKEMIRRLGDLTKKIKLQRIYLENTKSQVKASSKTYGDNEKILKSLQKQMHEIRNSASYTKQKQKSEIYDLKADLELIKTQIKEKNQIITHFNTFDKTQAKEIFEYIRENLGNSKDFSRDMNRKLEDTEEMINEKEQQLTEQSIEYEMKKSQRLHNLRKKKDEYSRSLRKKREDFRIVNGKATEEMRIDLRYRLNEARKNEFYLEPEQLSQCKTKLEVRYM